MALTRIRKGNIQPGIVDFSLLDVPSGDAGQALITDGAGNLLFQTIDDPFAVRASVGSGSGTITLGTLSDKQGKAYFITEVTINVTNPYAGAGVNHIAILDDSDTVFVSSDEADILNAGTYIVEKDWTVQSQPGATIRAEFRDQFGSLVVPSAGTAVIAVEYKTLNS